MKSKTGFTIIELLVVAAVTGLLYSVIFTSLNSVRNKVRHAWAQAELNQEKIVRNFINFANFDKLYKV